MIKRLFILLSVSLVTLLTPLAAGADDSQIFAVCKTNPGASICADKGTKKDPVLHVLQVATDLIAAIAGIAAVILIIISGVTMITSGGNQEAVSNSRRRIMAATVGLVVIALSWVIVSFAIDKFIKT